MPRRGTHIERHGNGWRFRRSAPARFHKALGRTAWIVDLGDVTQAEAERQGAAINLEVIRERAALKAMAPAQLAELEAAGGRTKWRERVKKMLADDRIDGSFFSVAAAMEPDEEQPDEWQAETMVSVLQSRRELEAIAARKDHVDEMERTLAGAGPREPKMFVLVRQYEHDRPDIGAKSRYRTRKCVERFVECVGDIAPAAVTDTHVNTFRDWLEAAGYRPDNVAAHLSKLQSVFTIGKSRRLVTTNPCLGVKALRKEKKRPKKPFVAEHYRTLFAKLPGEPADFAMLFRLLAYHGARSKEFAQLKCSDVMTLRGVPVLRVHGDNGRTKNESSVRDVPVHPECMDVIAYAAKVAAEHGADAWLFQSLSSNPLQGRAHNFQIAAGAFIRKKAGIPDSLLTLHSLRHGWIRIAGDLEMPERVARAITGHGAPDVHGKYGGPPSLQKRAEWIARIDPLA